MKKFPKLLTLLVIAVLALTACAGDGGDGQTTPGADMTAVPTLGDVGSVPGEDGTDVAGTPAAGDVTEEVETPTEAVETEAAETETATEAPDAAATPTLGADTGSTGGDTGIPNTGAEEQFVLLSNILKMSVESQDGEQLGNVQGVLINRQSVASGAEDMSGTGTAGAVDSTPSPEADAGTPAATEQPTADAGTGTTGDSGVVTSELDANARVEYVLVSLTGANAGNSGSNAGGNNAGGNSGNNAGSANAQETPTVDASGAGSNAGSANAGGNTVLVPWQAFNVSGMQGANSDMSSDSETPEAAATPEADAGTGTEAGADAAATPTLAGGSDTGSTDSGASADALAGGDQALVLTVDAAALTGAPAFDEAAFDGSLGGDVASYWSGQVTGIPATGADDAAGAGDYVLVRGQIGSVSVNGSDGQALGQVRDFVVDSETGELLYAVLGGGSAFGSDLYVVPFDRLTWQASQGQGASLGNFETDLAEDAFTAAPSFTNVDELEGSDWSSDVDSYWDSQ